MKRIDWNAWKKSKWFWPALGGVLLAGILIVFFLARPVSITPTAADSSGLVEPTSTFRITGPLGMNEENLRKTISVQPAFAYQVSRAEEGGFLLTPLHPLEAGVTYTLKAGSRSFTFQVSNKLVVTSVFPVDGGVKVPVRSGIEFQFNSRSLSLADFQKALTITPEVTGSVNAGDGRFVFYPDGQLDYETTYTVTLAPPLKTPGGAALAEAYTFSFTTQSVLDEKAGYMFRVGESASYNSLTSEAPLISLTMDKTFADSDVSVKLYRFPDMESYREQLSGVASGSYYDQNNSLYIDTSGLEEYATFEATPFPAIQEDGTEGGKSSYRSGWLLQFPEPLPEGWYAAEFTVTGEAPELSPRPLTLTRQLYLQVSDLSVFHMMSGPNLLLWVNDAATGQPVPGATMEVTGSYSAQATTGENGVAVIDTGVLTREENDYSGRDGGIFTITAGDRTFTDVGWFYDYESAADRQAREYLAYLFTDRPIYHSTDTIKVWGMVRPRNPGTAIPENLTLDFAQGAVTCPVEPEENGLFMAELPLEALSGDAYTRLQLLADGEIELYSLYLEVYDYVKPVYTADAAPEKPVYLLNTPSADPAIQVEATFFDGTPASDFSINADSWNDLVSFPGGSVGLLTDEDGLLRIPMRIGEGDSTNTWFPQSYSYTISNGDAQEENFYLYGNINVIHRDVMLRGRWVPGETGNSVEVTTHQVDISRITDSSQLWDTENIQGAALSRPVTAQLHRQYYTKEKTGTRYDFVTRTSVETFRYTRHDDVEKTWEFSTQNGSYTLTGLPRNDAESSYYLTLSTTDSTGKLVEYDIWLGAPYQAGGSSQDGHLYVLDKDAEAAPADAYESASGISYDSFTARSRFGDGEDVRFQLMDNDQKVESLTGRLLYVVVQDDFSHVTVTDAPQAELPFSEDLVPNYTITGAYFDGKHIFALEDRQMSFDPSARELDVRLETDQAAYAPGGEVTLTATVTEKATGKPAAGAELAVAVVDEAVFALREQDSDILHRLYRPVYYPTIQRYTSFVQTRYSTAGEKGGGDGGAETRKDFADTAQFLTAATDSSGKASFTFTLPDNITTWRFTSLALTDTNQAGSTVDRVAATKEFFVAPVVSQVFLEGDSITVGLRGAGTGVTSQSEARYTVTLEGDGVQETLEASGGVRSYQSVTFPGVAKGEYTLTIHGRCGQAEDTVELPLSVVETGLETTRVQTFDLSQGIQVDPLRWPVTIAIYDQSLQTYSEVLRSVESSCGTARADHRLARLFVARQLQTQGSDLYDAAALEEEMADLKTDSPIPLFPYGEPDLELTIKAALTSPDIVPEYVAGGILPENMAESGGRRFAGYLAQAINDNADIAAITALLENPEGLDFVDQMYLATALSEAGETEAAARWYDQLAAPKTTPLEGVSGAQALYIPAQGELSQGDCTAAASLLATSCGHKDADALVLWLARKDTPYEPYTMEQLFYLVRRQPKEDPKPVFVHENGDKALVGANELDEDAKAQFSYVRDGQRITRVLDHTVQRITFTRKQLAEADFQVPVGQVWADVYYTGSAREGLDPDHKRIPITKTIQPVGSDEITLGGLVKITLTPDLSAFDPDVGDNHLIIDDYIPTGMRFERYGAENDPHARGWSLISRQGQRVQFSVWNWEEEYHPTPIVYYARCAAPGEYVVESAYVSSAVGSTWGASDRDTVTIS